MGCGSSSDASHRKRKAQELREQKDKEAREQQVKDWAEYQNLQKDITRDTQNVLSKLKQQNASKELIMQSLQQMYDTHVRIDLSRRRKADSLKGSEAEYPSHPSIPVIPAVSDEARQKSMDRDHREPYEAYRNVWGDTVPDFGFRLQRPSNKIGWIAGGSRAKKVGLKVGDEIIAFHFSVFDPTSESLLAYSHYCSTAAEVEAALPRCTADACDGTVQYIRGNRVYRFGLGDFDFDDKRWGSHRALLDGTLKDSSDAFFPDLMPHNNWSLEEKYHTWGFELADNLFEARRILRQNDPAKINGHHVTCVDPGSPADEAGLRVGDEIVAVEGIDVRWQGPAIHSQMPGNSEDSAVQVYYNVELPLKLLLSQLREEGYTEPMLIVERGQHEGGALERHEVKLRWIEKMADLYRFTQERYRRTTNKVALETKAAVKQRGRQTYRPFNPSARKHLQEDPREGETTNSRIEAFVQRFDIGNNKTDAMAGSSSDAQENEEGPSNPTSITNPPLHYGPPSELKYNV